MSRAKLRTTAQQAPCCLILPQDHFAGEARLLSQHGYEVAMFDHRGVGRSGPPVLQLQSAASLAADAVALIDALWGVYATVHVYGCVNV